MRDKSGRGEGLGSRLTYSCAHTRADSEKLRTNKKMSGSKYNKQGKDAVPKGTGVGHKQLLFIH